MSQYIKHLRQHIGHALLVLPAVAVLIRDGEGRVLLVKQSDTGQWGTVGGAIDPDESPQVAGPREAEEETGLRVELTKLIDVLGGTEFRQTYPNGDEVSYVSAVYEARVVGGEIKPDGEETTDVAWFRPKDLATSDLSEFARSTFRALGWIEPLNPDHSKNGPTTFGIE